MPIDPVIVVGPPYSGTSVVARLCQTDHGIMMDEGPIRKDWRKSKGYYEDEKLRKINDIALLHGHEKVPLKWAGKFAAWLTVRSKSYNRWGFKDPGCVGIIKHMHQFFDNPTWIVCTRPSNQIVWSQFTKHGIPLRVAMVCLDAYKEIIQRELNGKCSYINFTEYVPEDKLSVALGEILNGSSSNRIA